ncbi:MULTISPECIES: hypothetical protein [unclassified Streptomyces]|uniref:hypothetical protein n=1 Tax=unclassified Streptomyces TaxID=2593676 RepID=UPI001F3A2649|nr:MULTISPECIES: hypothetical protein [unclassified Streptomyces]
MRQNVTERQLGARARPFPPVGNAGNLLATHLGPGRQTVVPDASWRRLLRDSARRADFGGPMVLGADLLRLPVRRRGPHRS